MPVINLPSGTVHFRDHGKGPALILLHANPGDSADYTAVIPALAQHFRVLAVDWPGYGQSPSPPQHSSISVRYFCNVLDELINALTLAPAIIVGNSLGGNAAARLAAQQPQKVRALILVAPGGFTARNTFTRAFCALQASRCSITPWIFAQLYLRRRTPATAAMLARASTSQTTPACIALNRAVWRSFGTPENDLRDAARAIRAPTLLVFGRYDPVIRAGSDGRIAKSCIANAELAILPCGHAAFAELPEQFLTQVMAFLRSHQLLPASILQEVFT